MKEIMFLSLSFSSHQWEPLVNERDYVSEFIFQFSLTGIPSKSFYLNCMNIICLIPVDNDPIFIEKNPIEE